MCPSANAGSSAALLAFGHLVKRLRLAADLTQEELAERASVSPRLISDLERGTTHRPRRDTVDLLANGLRLRGPERESFIALARGKTHIPLATGSVEVVRRQPLPNPPTPIVGRLKETAAATGLLLDPEIQLLTLTGLGGVGKTRLALEVAHRVGEALRDGAVFVDLAPVRDPSHLLTAIAQALGLVAVPDLPLNQQIVDAIRERPTLLVLDNFEQLVDAAAVVAELLAACPELKVLATSREPLHIRAEHEYPIGPLAVPDLDALPPLNELAQTPAVELLVRRAGAVNHEFALTDNNARAVAELVVRLDGLPLAIELSAPRLRILSPAELLTRLERRLPLLTGGARDLPARQQAIRATLDWSHDLLTAEEQALFRRLAVFAGGCSLDAAQDIGSAVQNPLGASPAVETVDLLVGLAEKSLLRATGHDGHERRFGMLETIREYGLERLSASGEEAEIRNWHRRWFLELAERAEPELLGPRQDFWYTRLRTERDNLRAALRWATETKDADAALRFGGALYRFWANQGQYDEGRTWLEQVLALDPVEQTIHRGNALIGAGVIAYFQGDYDRATVVWEEARTIFRDRAHITGIAYCYGNLGLVADARGDYTQAAASYQSALELFRQLNDRTHIGFMLHNLGLIAYFQGEFDRAAGLFAEALSLARELGDQNSIAMTLGNSALAALALGDIPRAAALQMDALSLGRRINNRPWLARGIEHVALIAAAAGEATRAARLFGAGDAVRRQFGTAIAPNDREINARSMATARRQIGDDAFAAAWAAGAALTLENAIADALDTGSAIRSRIGSTPPANA